MGKFTLTDALKSLLILLPLLSLLQRLKYVAAELPQELDPFLALLFETPECE